MGYFFDANRLDGFSYNASYVEEVNARYVLNEGANAWRNGRLAVYSLWGFRFEYYVNAISSLNTEKLAKNQFEIYPNPAADVFTIRIPLHLTATTIEISDMTGKKLYSDSKTKTGTVVLSKQQLNLTPGNYLVSIQTETSRTTRKLVLQ